MYFLKKSKRKTNHNPLKTTDTPRTGQAPVANMGSGNEKLGNKKISRKALNIFAIIFGLLGTYLIFSSFAAPPGVDPQTAHLGGRVNYVQPAEGSGGWDSIFSAVNSDPTKQQWLRDHYWRMRTYEGGFGAKDYDNWYPTSWPYQGAYTIYPGNEAAALDNMILRNKYGTKLWINYSCDNAGGCSQYAADISRPSNPNDGVTVWREHMAAQIIRQLKAGKFKGVFIDDVNYSMHVGVGYDIKDDRDIPVDSNTNLPMTTANWEKYMAENMEDLRKALDSQAGLCGTNKCEITHNTVWFDVGGHTNPNVKRGIATADFMEVERGFGDPDISGDSFQQLLDYSAYVQSEAADNDTDTTLSKKRGVVLDTQNNTYGREYNLATYFLVSNGVDSLANTKTGYPTWTSSNNNEKWWAGYDIDLGDPSGTWYRMANGVYRRDFANGIVLVNRPGAPTQTVSLNESYKRYNNTDDSTSFVSSVTLGASQGAVLVGQNATPPPPSLCSDSIDNDGDSKIDYPADPGCSSSNDTDEIDTIPPITGSNLSLNRPVTVSSVQDASYYSAGNAVDGNTATRWSSTFADPQWIQVDLGSAQNIGRVVLNWEAAYGKGYQIQTSNDNTTWTTIYSTVSGDGGIDDLSNLSGSGRYVRMNGVVRGTPYGYSLWEFQIYGASGSTPDPVADTIPPVVTIISPTSGANVSDTVTISAKATDNIKIALLETYIDGGLYISTTSDSLTTNWNTKPKRWKGPHTITVKAKDTAGKVDTKSIGVNVIR